VVKLDGDGKVLWQRCFGGSNSDSASSIQQTSDGEYIVAGATSSDDGDVSGNHGDADAWVVKLDAAGKVLWQRCLGGSNLDSASSIQQTSDGGYIVAGETSSDDGDVSGNHGDRDAWLVKLDADGKIAWQRCLGGSIEDGARSVQQTVDGGYILAGYTESIDGDVSGNHGDRDAWVVKLDDGGEISWQRCLGGSGWDDASSIQQTSDGGYILAAETWSYDGDVIGNHGWYDAWVVNMDADGAISWQRCLGGEGSDGACSVQQTSDGGYIVSGSVKYYENDRIRTRLDPPPVRALVVKLNADGAVAWHKELGGRWYGYSVGSSVQQTVDSGYIIAGTTYSDDGDVSGNHGDSDAWVVKLKSNGSMTTLDAAFTASPTSGPAPLTVQFTDTSTGTPTAWTWAFGDGVTSTDQHPVHTYTDPGTYTVSLTVDDAAGSDTETKADYITVAAPTVSIAWQRCLGGSGSDVASIVQQTSDGGYIVAGSTESTDGDVGGNHGGYDIWVVKLDAGGETAWQRCLGGSGTDVARSAHPTVDGGYIIGGQTNSTDGDVSGNHGKADIWLVKMDSGGNISWQRCIGGSNYEDISNVCQTSDGGYILTGETDSNDGDVSGYHDRNDTWLVKIDPDGLIEWEKSFGPIMINTCAQQTDDGGYVLCGWCWEGHGMFDGYVLKVDATGVLEWQSYLGGYCRDYVSSIRQTGDSGYIAAGSTESSDIDGYHRDPENYDSILDGMAVKINATGALEWQRGLGGYDSDTFRCVEQAADGGYILAGYTDSNDGDVGGNHGGLWDGWAVKLDSSGELEWQRCLGGSGDDKVQSVGQTSDGGYILAGSTDSNDGDVSGNHGASDIWVVKLENT
jgi:PKD repeat protein